MAVDKDWLDGLRTSVEHGRGIMARPGGLDPSDPCSVKAWLLADRSLYNASTGEALIPDMNGDGVFYGVQTARMDPEEVARHCARTGESPCELALSSVPAPGTGAQGRMGLVDAAALDLLCVEVAGAQGWGDGDSPAAAGGLAAGEAHDAQGAAREGAAEGPSWYEARVVRRVETSVFILADDPMEAARKFSRAIAGGDAARVGRALDGEEAELEWHVRGKPAMPFMDGLCDLVPSELACAEDERRYIEAQGRPGEPGPTPLSEVAASAGASQGLAAGPGMGL